MMDEQRCPWCYSEKFKIDFEEIGQKQGRRGVNANRGQTGASIGVSQTAEKEDDNSGRDMVSFSEVKNERYSKEQRAELLNQRRNQRNASIIR